ncbi:MAG: urease accessory protein UreD [Gammaproteobacteria bacterium]|nr:urease accessory protein UreD [Gammaproteobacteria bacterium]
MAILHPPGGVVGGDELRLDAWIGSGAHTLLTTPAAGKFYRSAGPLASQTQHLTVAAGAVLEWLPQENIFYSGARVHSLTQVELQGDARFLGWEILCLGRPAAAETFQAGECRQTLEIWRDGEPLYLERARYPGGDPILEAVWGLQGQPVSAILLCVLPVSVQPFPSDLSSEVARESVVGGSALTIPKLVDAIRTGWEPANTNMPIVARERVAVTALDGVLICRYLGASALRARLFFMLAWGLLRPVVLNRPPCPSRFWNT